ncbi:MAG TPA: GNAT family N-acetyltransferase [Streptosporangiales bacterium]
MVTIRQVTADDWPVWRDVRLAALEEAPHAYNSRLADWATAARTGGVRGWRSPARTTPVAFADARPVGVVRGVPHDDGTSELHSMWVSPDVRGQGVGDRLMAAVEEWAVRNGHTTLTLAVFPANDAALALYRRHGYVDTGEQGGLLRDGVTRELVLAKPLRPAASATPWRAADGRSPSGGRTGRRSGRGGSRSPGR